MQVDLQWKSNTNSVSYEDISKRGRHQNCSKIIIISDQRSRTKYFEYTADIFKEWCIIILVSDPYNFEYDRKERLFIISDSLLKQFPFRSTKFAGLSPIAKRNIAYLFATDIGADILYETTSESFLKDVSYFSTFFSKRTHPNVVLEDFSNRYFNVFSAFQPLRGISLKPIRFPFPRGLPIHAVAKNSYANDVSVLRNRTMMDSGMVNIGVFTAHSLQDLSTISESQKQTPIAFKNNQEVITLPLGMVSPFGSTSVIWKRSALPFSYTPISTSKGYHSTESIVHSYICQRLLSYFGGQVGLFAPFTPPSNYLEAKSKHSPDVTRSGDFSSFISDLVDFLYEEMQISSDINLSSLLQETYFSLHQKLFVDYIDVLFSEQWIKDFCEISSINCSNWKIVSNDSIPIRTGQRSGDCSSNSNVAVCVSGQVRTLDMSPSDEFHPKIWKPMRATIPIPNQTVAQSVQKNLYPSLGTPDVFMVISTRGTETEPKAGDMSTCETLRPSGGHLHCSVPVEENVPILRNATFWSTFVRFRRNNFVYVQGLLQQLKGMFDCYKEIERFSLQTGKTYDWIVRLRPDMYIHNFPNLEELKSVADVHKTIFYSNKEACCCGNEDTFAIGKYTIMAPYMERFIHLQQRDLMNGTTWSSESHLQSYLADRGINLIPHSLIKTCLVKPKNRRNPSDP